MERHHDLDNSEGSDQGDDGPDIEDAAIPTSAVDMEVSVHTSDGAPPGNSTVGEESANVEQATKGTKRDKGYEEEDDSEDGSVCPICMDSWGNSGSHRLASLRCGHLFGHSCIVRWLSFGCSGQKRCPQCNKKASLKEVRLLYAKKLQVLDTTERDRLKEQLDSVTVEKNRLEFELARAQLTIQLQQQETAVLKQQLENLKNTSTVLSQKTLPSDNQDISCAFRRLVLNKVMEVCKNGGCRVFAFSQFRNLLVVSQSSTNSLFPGYGIKKFNTFDFQPNRFVFLHSKQIRDLAFHPRVPDTLLSVSLDRSAKLLDISSDSISVNYQADAPLWSCCWHATESNIFFVGTQNGAVLQYDLRNISNFVNRFTVPGDTSPVTSIAAVPPRAGRTFSGGGFLVCKFNSCWAFEQNGEAYVPQQLPWEGPFTFISYDEATDHILVSTRPSSRSAYAQHMLCKLLPSTSDIMCEPVHTFFGSTLQKFLSRPCLIPFNDEILIAAHIESSNTVGVWSRNTGSRIISVPTTEPVIDLCPLKVDGVPYVATLSEKMLRVYQVTT